MTDLHRNPKCKLEAVTAPRDFMLGRTRRGCQNCQDVTLHSIRADGGTTFYKCRECGGETTRGGAIR